MQHERINTRLKSNQNITQILEHKIETVSITSEQIYKSCIW